MSNIEQYNQILCETLGLGEKEVVFSGIRITSSWGSLNHLVIVTQLEDAFNCTFSPEDIFSFSSYEKGLEILRAKGVQI